VLAKEKLDTWRVYEAFYKTQIHKCENIYKSCKL